MLPPVRTWDCECGGACCQRACASAVVLDVNGGCWNSGTANRVGNSVGTSCRAQKFGDRPGMAAAELLDVNGVCGNSDKANRDSDSVGTSCRAQKFGDRPGVVSAELSEVQTRGCECGARYC
jgi:hypothetical protein